jgi:hypothetical protein
LLLASEACVLGIAFRFLVLIPATLILIAIALLSATSSTAEVMLVAWVGVQVGYLGGVAARMCVGHGILRGPHLPGRASARPRRDEIRQSRYGGGNPAHFVSRQDATQDETHAP